MSDDDCDGSGTPKRLQSEIPTDEFEREGWEAYFAGVERRECHLDEDTDQRGGWMIGWNKARAAETRA